ncbi:MAG TPA: VCBS repeat-containing protein, partial [Gammaproteobacteria bacterium]|nr:VCBS repeat-containing protein [Gammaproteobacteria bacterium]
MLEAFGAGASRCMVIAGALCGAAAASADPLYRDVTTTHLPGDVAGACMNAAAGDADGDGDLDLALAMEFQPKVLLLNDGAARFTNASSRLPPTVHDSEDAAFADFDRDGDLDLVFVSEDDRKDELFINDGAARFSDASSRLATDDVSNALAVFDLNGDGTPDLLTGNIGTDRALIADGRGGFRDETAERWPQSGESRTQDLELADVDGDGDLDVLVGNEGQNQLFLNEKGRLVDVTARSLPARSDETRKIRAADVDGDGDLDLIVANVRFVLQESPQDYLLLNDGSGVFAQADPARFPEDARDDFTLQTLDLDHDGDVD